MKAKVKKLPKSTLQLEISVPAEDVKKAYDTVLEKVAKSADIKGFRKGKAPKDMVEKNLDPSKLRGEVVNHLLEKYYIQALKENKINPISNPKVEIQKFDMEEDFEFTATVATRPEVKLGDYKKALKKKLEERHNEVKKQKEQALKEGKKMPEIHDHLHTQEIIRTITETAEVEVPDLLVEDEIDRMRARLVDQMQNIDMGLDDYLKAKNQTAEQLNAEFTEQAVQNLKAEFVLAQAITETDIEVTDEEIEEMAKASGDPEAIENLKDPANKWYIKNILEKNKFLTDLMEELEGSSEEKGEKEEGAKGKKSENKETKKKKEDKVNKKEEK
ncbi:hypothetical protein GF360_03560 [candidate division WWE3 bacterium]|nr:hypothetical protein [candidate division WWE3 bacterium]